MTRRAAVIGHPVAHSLSPEIFAAISRASGLEIEYDRRNIAPGALTRSIRAGRLERALVGFNVTLPHKQAVAKRCDRLAADARAIGAVNVIHFTAGRIEGHNTDAQGVERALTEAGVDLRGKTALVLGAGGGALAAGFALGRAGARHVVFANRTPSRAIRVARRLGRLFPRTLFEGRAVSAPLPAPLDLCINATPVGMAGFPAASLLPATLGRSTVVFDMVYRPLETPFLREAKKRGCRTVDGLDMLIWQALATYRIWFGRRHPLTADQERRLRKNLRRRLVNILRSGENEA